MEEYGFKKLRVYDQAKILHKKVFIVTAKLPTNFGYLVNQIRRASLSVVLNIAEGSTKRSRKDFNRYIETSLGSLHEVIAGLDVIKDLAEVELAEIELGYSELKRQLGALSKKLKSLN